MAQPTSSKSAADGAAQAAEGAAQAANAAAHAAADADRVETHRPIVYEATMQRPIVFKVKKAKKKKKYSRGSKDSQKVERGASRAAERIAQAVADGISEYRDRRDKSARKKRDGAIKDAVRNTGRGWSEGISTAAKAPTDLTRRMSTKRLTRMMPLPPFGNFMRGR